MWDEMNVRNWIGRAAYALRKFYDAESHEFYRDSGHQGTGSMSTNRAFLALAEFLYYHDEEARPSRRKDRTSHSEARHILNDMRSNYYGTSGDERYRSHSGHNGGPYTDAHALLAMVAAEGMDEGMDVGPGADDPKSVSISHKTSQLAEELVAYLSKYTLDSSLQVDADSPVVEFQVIRAVDAVATVWACPAATDDGHRTDEQLFLDDLVRDEARRRGNKPVGNPQASQLRETVTASLRSQSRENVLRQLGLHSGKDPEFDPGSLLAATCILQRFGGRSGRQLIARSIEVIAESQDDDGSWRADLVTVKPPRLVYVSSLEMATMVANLLIAELSTGPSEYLTSVIGILERCFAHLEAGYIDRTTADADGTATIARGWGNDRMRQGPVAEVWTTALALQLLLRLNRIGALVEQQSILAGLNVTEFRSTRVRWPDLQGVLPDPSRSKEELDRRIEKSLGRASDPTVDRKLVNGIINDIVQPILSSRIERPNQIASLLLYGPPGTRKTSLVSLIAEALQWPLVVISPPEFLMEGIEGLERRAQEIFLGLERLRRVVIIFDECEELLRRRLPVGTPENRTHGAFITAGMLPRLQQLRDRSWSVFVIVTNTELDELDPAVVRRGRLDQRRSVQHPVPAAQKDYLIEGINRLRGRVNTADDALDWVVTEDEAVSIEAAVVRYEKDVLSEVRKVLKHDRVQAAKERDKGDLRAYFVELGKVVAREWDLAEATFGVLDEMVETLAGYEILTSALVYDVLVAAAGGDSEEK